jgi:hypothetical protein
MQPIHGRDAGAITATSLVSHLEFKNRRKSRSRRGNEVELFCALKIRLLSATIFELTLAPLTAL